VITLKSDREFEKMEVAGGCVAAVHQAVREAAKPGVSLKDLDDIAAEVTSQRGCTPSFLHYQPSPHQTPYPGHLCLSVNDVIVHGIPSGYKLRSGDILSVDAGAIYEGFHGDAAFTMGIGDTPSDAARLVATTEESMWAGIRAIAAGSRLGDIGAAVQAVGDAAGYGIVREYVGHGIGRQMHEEPQVPNLGTAGKGIKLRVGMALCVEPMFNAGGWETRVDPDGWTVRTADGSLSAHFEHTVAITRSGVRVMTMPGAPDLADIPATDYNSRPVYGTQST
jgi:methionyl aminopeptidase